MTHVYLIRHGETEANRKGLFHGWSDHPLNETGEAQAIQLSEFLQQENIRFDHIACSPLQRAMKTAELGFRHLSSRPEMTLHDDLRECHAGTWEDMTPEAISAETPDAWEVLMRDWKDAKPHGGESVQEMHERVCTCMDALVEEYKGKTLAVVSHSGPIRSLIAHLLGQGVDHVWRYAIRNASFAHIVINEEGFAWLDTLNPNTGATTSGTR